ncbi:MAG: DUF1761 domain-containing protein [Chitinophagaceae bacterium]|nr:DUF1761 domain-containing protein [Chitinophagaceae bacterium]
MNTQKFLVSGIVGAIVSFFAGYLIYGTLLMDFFKHNTGSATGVPREMSEIIWWSLIVANLCWGLLYSYILNRAGANSLGAGAGTGFVIGLLFTAAADLTMYATSNVSNSTGTFADIACGAVMGLIVGAAVGLTNGMQAKKAAA